MNDDTAEWPSWFGDDDVADWLRERLPGWEIAVKLGKMFTPYTNDVIRVQAKSPCGVLLTARKFDEPGPHWSACTSFPKGYGRKTRFHLTPECGVRFALSKARKIRLKKG